MAFKLKQILIINTKIFFRKRGACCPVDSKPLHPEKDLFKDLFTKREIAQQRTHCLYQQNGCTLELSPIDLESHLNECLYRQNTFETEKNCPFRDIGCLTVLKTPEALKQHLEKNMNMHLTV